MMITLIFLAVLLAFFLGWILSRSVNVQPWVADGGHLKDALPAYFTIPRMGLAIFMAVASSVFALAISAYHMRMEWGPDWLSVPNPSLLWLNTAILMGGSLALQSGWNAARREDSQALRRSLWMGGLLSLAFVLGQWLVWQNLTAAGYGLAGNPANSFFYLLTALHVVHLLGGLVVWARTMWQLHRGAAPEAVSTTVELCTLYWHYLLVVWCVLFALLLTT